MTWMDKEKRSDCRCKQQMLPDAFLEERLNFISFKME